MQPKLNGIRAIWRNGKFYSRKGEVWCPNVVRHISDSLKDLDPSIILDGEFYRHGYSLQQITSAISVVRYEPTEATPEIYYNVFDLVDYKLPFLLRSALVKKLGERECIHIVPTFFAGTLEFAEQMHKIFIEQKYEGSIYRMGDCKYGSGRPKDNRSKQLIRRKHVLDDVFYLHNYTLGKVDGRLSNVVGTLICMTKDNKPFEVGTGLTDSQRIWLTSNFDSIKGVMIRVEFECYSDTGIPLKPRLADDKFLVEI